MDNIPTKEELDAKAEEVHALWLKARKVSRDAAACEEELKEMRYQYYLNRLDSMHSYEGMVKEEDNYAG